MKRFTLTIGSQSLQFTELDIPLLDEALNAATHCAGREMVRYSASGERVSVKMEHAGDTTLARDPRTVLMRDLDRGPEAELTDC